MTIPGGGGGRCDLPISHLTPSQQSSGNAEQLSLSHREVLSVLHHLRVQLQGQLGHLMDTGSYLAGGQPPPPQLWAEVSTHTLLHVTSFQSIPDLLLAVLVKRVQVGPANMYI